MKQLAELAGISIGAVSLALRDHPRISVATRQRVQQLAHEYQYIPGRGRLPAGPAQRDAIGCIVPDITCTFYARLLRGILERSQDFSYHVITLETRSRLLLTCQAVQSLIRKQVAGILIASEHAESIPRELITDINRRRIIPISLDTTPFEIPVDEVRTDELELARMAVDYLFHLGHRTIAYFGAMPGGRPYGRTLAIRQLLKKNNLTTRYMFDLESYHSFDAVVALRNLSRQTLPPTAIICGEDRVAAKLLQAALELGIRIPHDISILGCANLDIAELTYPTLTTVEQNPEKMGRQAVELLVKRQHQENQLDRLTTVITPIRLVERHSCAAARGTLNIV